MLLKFSLPNLSFLLSCPPSVSMQAESELHRVREELERETEAHQEITQRLVRVEKEAKSSSLMSMELEDYQRSIQNLEGGMATKEGLLENARKDSQIHQESLQLLRRDMGMNEHTLHLCLLATMTTTTS